MAALPVAAPERAAHETETIVLRLERRLGPLATPRCMTRCECSGMTFDEIAREVAAEGRPLPEVLGRTGCGQTCGACLPDLARHLASRR